MTDRYKLTYTARLIEDETNTQFAAIMMSALAASSLLFVIFGETQSALGLAGAMLIPVIYLYAKEEL
jgi:hypothetical protein